MDKAKYQVKINEGHLDFFGHVNNAKYLELYEEARWDFINKVGQGIEYIKKVQKGPVVLGLSIKFKKELLNQDQITIYSNVTGQKSSKIIILNQRIERGDGELISTVDIEIGLMDLKERKLITPDSNWVWL